jgi:hypothetical protein
MRHPRLNHVVLAHSRLDDGQLRSLRATGWVIGLLDLPEAVMRSRAEERQLREGWSNVEWLPEHLRNIEHLRAGQVFTHVFDATLPTTTLALTLAEIMSGGSERG